MRELKMGQLVILATVDTQAVLDGHDLAECIYMVDNNKPGGSTGQGTANLVTHVLGSQVLCYMAFGLNIGVGAPILQFVELCGEAVEQSIMVANQFEAPNVPEPSVWWGATVASNAKLQQYNYTMKFKIGDNSKIYSHDAAVLVKTAFSNAS